MADFLPNMPDTAPPAARDTAADDAAAAAAAAAAPAPAAAAAAHLVAFRLACLITTVTLKPLLCIMMFSSMGYGETVRSIRPP
jgi:hypothetical protein